VRDAFIPDDAPLAVSALTNLLTLERPHGRSRIPAARTAPASLATRADESCM
jgi:hypothetical protein